MPLLPQLQEPYQQKIHTETFGGYNHKLKISANDWYETTNLNSDAFPMLGSRPLRGIVSALDAPGGCIAKDGLLVVDGENVLYNGYTIPVGLNDITPKQLVSMGAYLVIFPDKKYLNTADLDDFGDLEASWESQENEAVTYSICNVAGDAYENLTVQAVEPQNPANGAYWIDTSGETHVLKQWSSDSGIWTQIPTVYTRISATGIGKNFRQYDGVTISGCAIEGSGNLSRQIDALNGSKVIYHREDDSIVVVGLLDQTYTQTTGVVSARRSVPDMDYVCEAGNRLWGCKYGLVDGKTVNEIYACKLGDFKNWNCFLGISTDSWAASVGSDGQWTAACNYLGYPTFFKEGTIHRVSISSSGAHQIQETICSGVERGSWRSPCVAGEILYYKGISGIYAYDGSQPVDVSDALGGVRYRNAVAGAIGKKYYVSMEDMTGVPHLFVLDADRGIWMREDNTRAMMFAQADGDLFYIDETDRSLRCVMGSVGTAEKTLHWEAVSGVQHYEQSEKKYVSRYNFRVKLDPKGSVQLYIQYDSDGKWEFSGSIKGGALRTCTIPVRPRRCDHLQYKLCGEGEFRLFSVTRILEQGSDA